jgi:hypothetical protein
MLRKISLPTACGIAGILQACHEKFYRSLNRKEGIDTFRPVLFVVLSVRWRSLQKEEQTSLVGQTVEWQQ